ncbi:ATP-dependent DNA helicase II subunit 1 [Myotisia sp. PD_48]|nr:ATP-dependent DNA helicase II subunit 1 [Myotisia sp. PD_48]
MAENYNYNREEEEEEEEEIGESTYKAVKDAVLFAVEVSESMLTPPETTSKNADKDAPINAALKSVYHLMQQRIISNPRDMIGLLLYGTEKSRFYEEDEDGRGTLPYPHCYLYTDLDVPSASDVKSLRALANEDEVSEDILVPTDNPVAMANVLFCANQIFTSKAANFSSRRLFIVTDNDNPHGKEKTLRSAATVRAKDLYDLGVIIELFPISKPGQKFDRSKFYDDIIYRASPTDPEAPIMSQIDAKASTTGGDGISLLNSLISNISSKSVPRRALFSNVPLEIGPNLKISVSGFLIFKRQAAARSSYIWLGGEVPEIAKGTTTQLAEDSAREIEKWEVRKAYKFGGEQVAFTQEEQTILKLFGDPTIRIIGFKPLSALPIWASMKHSTFIYPSEEGFIGSTRTFSALHQTLSKQQKMALVWFVPRQNAAPVMAAMIAGDEKLDENGLQCIPQGMWILPLPFADDIRQNPETNHIVSPESLVDKMREIVQQLQLPKAQFDPLKYPNPSLQWHYRILQALALDEDLPEKPEDKTIPKYRAIDKRAGNLVISWGEELEAQSKLLGLDQTAVALPKRPAPNRKKDAGEPASKRAKTEERDDLKMAYEKGTLSKLTVVILKEFLVNNGLSTSGKKADLVERIEEFFEHK